MRFIRSKWLCAAAIVACTYGGSFVAIKLLRPASFTSNTGPGHVYRAVYLPLRFASASVKAGYWKSLAAGHWQTVKVIWNNPGNGYLQYDDLDGRPGRVFVGWDLAGAKEGEAVDIHLSFQLRTWDDFSDHLIAGVDRVRRTNQIPKPSVSSGRGSS